LSDTRGLSPSQSATLSFSPLTRQARRPSCSSLVGSPESPLPLSPKKPSLDLIDVDLPYKDILPSFASGPKMTKKVSSSSTPLLAIRKADGIADGRFCLFYVSVQLRLGDDL
jgi:hypothetical protein